MFASQLKQIETESCQQAKVLGFFCLLEEIYCSFFFQMTWWTSS